MPNGNLRTRLQLKKIVDVRFSIVDGRKNMVDVGISMVLTLPKITLTGVKTWLLAFP